MERSQGMWMDKIDAFCDWREAGTLSVEIDYCVGQSLKIVCKIHFDQFCAEYLLSF